MELDSSSVLRIVQFFDGALAKISSIEELIRDIARLMSCPVGLIEPDGRVLAQFDGNGDPFAVVPSWTAFRDISLHDAPIARLWIGRKSPTVLDELILDRSAMAISLISERTEMAPISVRALVELLVDDDVMAASRARACRQLGYDPAKPVRIAVVYAPGRAACQVEWLNRAITASGGPKLDAAVFSDEAIIVLRDTVDLEMLTVQGVGTRLGIGPALPAALAPQSFRGAQESLQFTQGPGARPIAQFDQLGPMVALAHIASIDLTRLPDVVALSLLARTESGRAASSDHRGPDEREVVPGCGRADESAPQQCRVPGRSIRTRSWIPAGRPCQLVPRTIGHPFVATVLECGVR